MRRPLILALLAATAVPAVAQAPADVARWNEAQARYSRETAIYEAERDRFEATRGGRRDDGYRRNSTGYPGGPDGNFATDYDAARHYRNGPGYSERVLADDDQVYRGSDGRYYCQRTDGTTGLIVGGAAGGILGNVIDGGRHRTGGTLIGGALGALLGRSVQQSNDQVRCR